MGERYTAWVARLLGCTGAELVAVGRDRTPQAALARLVAATAEALVVADRTIEADPRVVSALAELGAGACLAVPLPTAGQAEPDDEAGVHAVLLAWHEDPRTWSSEELADLEELARVAALDTAAPAAGRSTATAPDAAEAESRRGLTLLSLSESLSATRSQADVAHAVELVALIQLGCSDADLWLLEDDHLRLLLPRGRDDVPALRVPLSHDRGPHGLVAVLGGSSVGAGPETGAADGPIGRPVGTAGPLVLLLPLTVGEQTLGVLDLRWEAPTRAADDRPMLEALASYTAQALQRAALLQERLDALITLQQSLLPRLRPIPGVEVAARYLPADSRDRVGGDWYDAVALPDGGCAVTVGDVVGHDVHAAAAMGQVRTVLRALAWSGSGGPAATLTSLDLALDGLGLDTLATAVVAHLRPGGSEDAGDSSWQLAWASAGHPPPVLLGLDGTTRLLEPTTPDGVDLMLGVAPGTDRDDRTLAVPAGSVLLLYTDGLIERGREHLDDGLDRLRGAVEEVAAGGGAASLDDLLDGVLTRVTGGGRADDIAVLAVRWGS
ncbi:PP2C family protein-serine/threonine phosphatase [Nocardioides fonticola]|uniref:PP2C family protein-serine/threonine phosphatase n=1 Tax=Nocardioides fonticola TaxID=450363 RepID=UPI0031CE2831